VIPAVIAVAVGLLWTQKSDLRTEPAGYFVSRTYEARDPTAVLASVGIDPVSVRAFPDVNNQILILQSGEIRSEVSRLIGEDIPVTIVRNRPTFSLIDTLESDGQSSFIFQSAGVPTYSFSCTGAVRNLCDKAIDAYVSKAVELRAESFRAGLEDLKAILLKIDQSSEDASITTKILALNELLSRLETPLTQIGRYEDTIGATITSVRRPTYIFGIGAGVIVALLILLQLTFSDRRVRSVRQLSQLAPAALLGVLPPKRDAVRDRRAAVSIQHSVVRHHATKIRFIPLREVLDDSSAIDRLSAMLTATTYISLPFAGLSVPEITQPATGELDVIIVRRNLDLRTDVVEARIALESSGRILAGVLFVG